MASQHTQGAKLRTPKGFNKLLAVNIGYGVDQHGQDATVSSLCTASCLQFVQFNRQVIVQVHCFVQEAAVRAVQNAMGSTALPGVLSMVPGELIIIFVSFNSP